jgi:hypothetical protein
MENFIIPNVHHATPKKPPKIIPNVFPLSIFLVYEKKIHLKQIMKLLKI